MSPEIGAPLPFRVVLALTVDGIDGANSVKWEPQVYNAYFKVKTPGPYVWVGHNRPAFGLGSYFDSHGLLLRTLAIQGFGYDRDWGGGLYKDFSWGDIAASCHHRFRHACIHEGQFNDRRKDFLWCAESG